MITKTIELNGTDYRILKNGDVEKIAVYYGKSTDAKPTDDVNNADCFYEIDTTKVYLFDEDSKTWIEQ